MGFVTAKLCLSWVHLSSSHLFHTTSLSSWIARASSSCYRVVVMLLPVSLVVICTIIILVDDDRVEWVTRHLVSFELQ